MDAYTAALRILNYRFNSEAELRRKLRRKEFSADEIDAAIERLRGEKWLDDERFAGAFVRARSAKRVGPRRIRQELGAAGVSESVARGALDANAGEDQTREALTDLCVKRMRILTRKHGEDYVRTDEGRQKLVAYLVRKGYELGDVFDVLRAQR